MKKQTRLELRNVNIRDEFFSPILDKITHVTAPDVLTKFEHDRGGAIDNFDRVRDGVQNEHAGPEWYDGLTYETIAGISDLMVKDPDMITLLHLESYAARIAAAALRDPNGYINTYTQLMEPDHRFGENGGLLRGQHDVYNPGALVEAAVHHYKATGKTTLLDTAVRFAEYLCRLIGKPPKKNIVPAHSGPEEAMVELYRLFRDDAAVQARYPEAEGGRMFLDLSQFWIENRGNHCGLPDWEHWDYEKCVNFIKDCKYGNERPYWGSYAQDHKPVLEQDTIEGHAVRAVLLFTGVAACAYENDRSDYIETAQRIWKNMVYKRMHVSGGVGAVHEDEKFGPDYYLPHDGYLETCAAIGAIFFCHNMYLLTGEAKYMDALENGLYNGAMVGVSLKGNNYSYINPLISDGTVHRWDWHCCPCCPPMDLKLYGRLPQFIYSQDQDSVSVNLFISGDVSFNVDGKKMGMRQETKYPWNGKTTLSFEDDAPKELTLRVRIPGWCDSYEAMLNGEKVQKKPENGYLMIKRTFKKGDVVTLIMDMPVRMVCANPKAEACKDQVAIKRGPILYCLEETDNPKGVEAVIEKDTKFEAVHDLYLLGGVTVVEETMPGGEKIKAVPFFRWDNREQGKMRVWLHAADGVIPEMEWNEEELYKNI